MKSTFRDFDQVANYKNFLKAISSAETSNVVVDFDDTSAYAGLDLEDRDVDQLLEKQVS